MAKAKFVIGNIDIETDSPEVAEAAVSGIANLIRDFMQRGINAQRAVDEAMPPEPKKLPKGKKDRG